MSPAPSTQFEGTRSVQVNGTTLSYREAGQGEPVVFVHGSLSDLRTWQYQLAPLGERYRAIAYSRRYARPNDDLPRDADDQVFPHADDLAAFLEAVGAAPAHLVGNSWGAVIALATALRHPRAVRSLVLEEPPLASVLFGPGSRPALPTLLRSLVRWPGATVTALRFGAGTLARAQKLFARGDDLAAMQVFVDGVLGRESYDRFPEARKRQMVENLSALRAQLLGAGLPPISAEDVRAVRAPALLLCGERSPAFFHGICDVLAKLLPSSERGLVPGASHAMHEEAPASVNAQLLAFLDRQRTARMVEPVPVTARAHGVQVWG